MPGYILAYYRSLLSVILAPFLSFSTNESTTMCMPSLRPAATSAVGPSNQNHQHPQHLHYLGSIRLGGTRTNMESGGKKTTEQRGKNRWPVGRPTLWYGRSLPKTPIYMFLHSIYLIRQAFVDDDDDVHWSFIRERHTHTQTSMQRCICMHLNTEKSCDAIVCPGVRTPPNITHML